MIAVHKIKLKKKMSYDQLNWIDCNESIYFIDGVLCGYKKLKNGTRDYIIDVIYDYNQGVRKEIYLSGIELIFKLPKDYDHTTLINSKEARKQMFSKNGMVKVRFPDGCIVPYLCKNNNTSSSKINKPRRNNSIKSKIKEAMTISNYYKSIDEFKEKIESYKYNS
jgi:hypothetical protein